MLPHFTVKIHQGHLVFLFISAKKVRFAFYAVVWFWKQQSNLFYYLETFKHVKRTFFVVCLSLNMFFLPFCAKLNCRNILFKTKETTNEVPRNVFRDFEKRKRVPLIFWRPKDNMKSKCHVFSGYKIRNKTCFVYLQCKLQPEMYGGCFLKL